jgi:hypothetical protein
MFPARITDNRLMKQNSVLLISNKEKVEKTAGLFRNNKAYAHKCPNQWHIQFWESPMVMTDDINFNTDCEKFQQDTKQILADVSEFAHKIEGGSPYFIYNLKIPTTIDPDLVAKDLGSDLYLFFLYGTTQNLPFITFRLSERVEYVGNKKNEELERMEAKVKEQVIVKTKELLVKLNAVAEIVQQSSITIPVSGSGDGEVENVSQVTVRFKKNVELNTVANFITENGGNIQDKKVPESYFVQLVSNQKSISVVKQQIIEKFSFIEDVFEFPNKR